VGKIRLLDTTLISQIAAGEVIERPSSALKELIENSLDAGATRCDVEIEGGGVTRLRVSDDGYGMSPEDAPLALERHATSKIASFQDLLRVQSFGFRGEALPSIAAVSRFVLRTRVPEQDAGVEIRIDAGAEARAQPIGMPSGTTIELCDLFYNVPARRKFLRSSATESGHCADVVENAALSRSDVAFTFSRDGRVTRRWLRASDRQQRVQSVLSDEVLTRVSADRGPLSLEAYLCKPERATVGAQALRLFVNQRVIKDRAIAATIAQAYGSVLERGRYPRGVVYLTLPSDLFDVNVHPQKAEVRFVDPRALCDAIYHLISRQLSQALALPLGPRTAPLPKTPQSENTTAPENPPAQTSATPEYRSPLQPEAIALHVNDAARPISPSEQITWSSLKFVAQLKQTYLLCEGEDAVYIVDQHAAAERVTFDRLRKQYRSQKVAAQSLLFPLMIDVTAEEAEFVSTNISLFARLGLTIEPRGERQLSVHAMPKLLQSHSCERLVRDILSESLRRGGRAFSDAVDLQLATMACHGSLRAGDTLAADEATALLRALDQADFAGYCPHGRPVVARMPWSELERKVGRR
jgi:DNA mismatch repair protein MutL